MTSQRLVFCTAVVVLCSIPLVGQHHRDPLNPLEIDQLRDAAQEPDARLKLYINFTRVRLTALEQAFFNSKDADRGHETHDRLQDFLDIYDEFDQNIDTFADRKADMRKVLKLVIEADTEFQSKLRAIHDSATVKPEVSHQYDFLLTNALDAVDNGAQDHRQLLAEQEEAFKRKKKSKAEGQSSRPE